MSLAGTSFEHEVIAELDFRATTGAKCNLKTGKSALSVSNSSGKFDAKCRVRIK